MIIIQTQIEIDALITTLEIVIKSRTLKLIKQNYTFCILKK